MKRERRLGSLVAAAALPVLFILAPIGLLALHSLFEMEAGEIVPRLSLANYRHILFESDFLRVLFNTLLLCGGTVLLCILLGCPISWFIFRLDAKWRYPVLLMLVLPMFMSYIVKLYTMRSILGFNGLLNQLLVATGILDEPSRAFLYNQSAVLITLAVIFLPFLVLPVYLALDRIPRSLLEAAGDLGAGPWQSFRHVVLPMALPGVVTGAFFVMVLALGDFVTPQMVGGPSTFTFGRIIWSQFGLAYNWPLGAALGMILFLVCGALILLAGLAQRKGAAR